MRLLQITTIQKISDIQYYAPWGKPTLEVILKLGWKKGDKVSISEDKGKLIIEKIPEE